MDNYEFKIRADLTEKHQDEDRLYVELKTNDELNGETLYFYNIVFGEEDERFQEDGSVDCSFNFGSDTIDTSITSSEDFGLLAEDIFIEIINNVVDTAASDLE